MKNSSESVIVFEKEVMCCGSPDNPALGHPCIYLYIQSNNQVECPYCGKVFIYDNSKN